ncbi:MAG TPA: DUF4118 domain-containing protein [Mycobacteriales bacterium]|jgi:signal transduction histidine kinase
MTEAVWRRLIKRTTVTDRHEARRARARRWVTAVATSAVLVIAVSLAVSVLDDHAPVLPLIVLYLLAVVPVAVLWGMGLATATSVASVLVFAYFFVPAGGHVALATSDTWYTLFVFEFTAVVVAELTTRSQRAARTSVRLADEQRALRRVATVVAQQATTPDELYVLICREVGTMLSADLALIGQFDEDRSTRVMGRWIRSARLGKRDPTAVIRVIELISQTNRPAGAEAPRQAAATSDVTMSAVGAPIMVEGSLWGAIVIAADSVALPPTTSERLADFTALVATAIANAKNRAELAASRQRLVVAGDTARRRIERDLHDGTQQHLVAHAIDLQAIQQRVPAELPQLHADLARVIRGLTDTLDHIREIAGGIHPAILAQGGLGPALKTLARRCPVPVEVEVNIARRPSDQVEVAAYYVVAESLTNAVKHANATLIQITGDVDEDQLRIRIRDDGHGGANPARGSGLVGVTDRAEALGGTLTVHSAPHAGTSVELTLPIHSGSATP